MKTCLGDTHSPNLHLFSSQPLSKFSDNSNPPPICLCVMLQEACGRQHREEDSTLRPAFMAPDNKKKKKKTTRYPAQLCSFLPMFKVQHPTPNIQPSALPLTSANRTCPAAALAPQRNAKTPFAHCSLLPCNTAANLGCFFGET
jgi:hypothetical protein